MKIIRPSIGKFIMKQKKSHTNFYTVEGFRGILFRIIKVDKFKYKLHAIVKKSSGTSLPYFDSKWRFLGTYPNILIARITTRHIVEIIKNY